VKTGEETEKVEEGKREKVGPVCTGTKTAKKGKLCSKEGKDVKDKRSQSKHIQARQAAKGETGTRKQKKRSRKPKSKTQKNAITHTQMMLGVLCKEKAAKRKKEN